MGTAAATFVLVDLLAGFVAFSLIVLGTLWYFAYSWTVLAGEAASAGGAFGTAAQLADATGLLFVLPMAIALVLYLARSAFQLPKRLWRAGMGTPG